MRNRKYINNILNTDRKNLYTVLSLVIVLSLALTVVYAALSSTLNINGNAEISAASWDIYLDNVVLNNQSVTQNTPSISNKTTATFSTTLNKPGDIYEFTIDVVNNGSIDAMIDGVTKTPTLTEAQAKYLNYIVEYQNGESVNNKQLVAKNSFVRLKAKLEFRKDISAADLPTQPETLNLSFTINYVQSDETGTGILNNGVKEQYEVINGTGSQVGDQICIGEECFYVISSNEETITMLAKYNLLVGNQYNISDDIVTPLVSPTGIQDESAIGYFRGNSATNPLIGTIPFSALIYWDEQDTYPINVYNNNSNLYNYIENYKSYLNSKGPTIITARLISYEELEQLGCTLNRNTCASAPSWVYSTTYWTSSAGDKDKVWNVISNGYAYADLHNCNRRGVRPVIEISRNLI